MEVCSGLGWRGLVEPFIVVDRKWLAEFGPAGCRSRLAGGPVGSLRPNEQAYRTF